MKLKFVMLLLTICALNSSCLKKLLEKEDKPVDDIAKYSGMWKAIKVAVDLNSNKEIEENEKGAINGSSELKLETNSTYTFNIIPATGNAAYLSGSWKMGTDAKSINITDNAQGSLRFDIKSNTEIITEPIISGNGQASWLIYVRL